MRKAIALVIMIVVCSIYFIAMDNVEKDQQVNIGISDLVEELSVPNDKLKTVEDIIKTIENGYPSTPKALMEMNNIIMGAQYHEEVSDEIIQETVKALRMLYSHELLNLNDKNRQLELLKIELENNKKANLYLIGSVIESIAFPTPETAFVETIHEMTKGSQKRQYTLIKQDGLWKIHSWKDITESER